MSITVALNQVAALLIAKGIHPRESAPYRGRPTVTFFSANGSTILDWPEPALMKAHLHLFYGC